ncbi:hypothetical protein Lfu02_77290 [Longispora fulva]|uniref:Transposase n=1 Tax=Longispora fulva TaxID=619741 RepID=A0A8J7GQD8_9ACTN|nr:hypothetical protein [Longispora fulva]GIG63357.1 hypothetical protein Lfu02_77290 [Longispora fulva]
MRDYVRKRRPQIAADAGRAPETAFILQNHVPGAEAEVGFGDVWVELAGELTKCFLFAFRLSFSGKAVHKIFASQGQEAFIEGHLHAFDTIGGVPTDKIGYDNLKSAVSRVLLGRNRTESRSLGGVSLAHGLRRLLLPAQHRRSPRERRSRRRRRPVPAHAPVPGSGRRHPRRPQRRGRRSRPVR